MKQSSMFLFRYLGKTLVSRLLSRAMVSSSRQKLKHDKYIFKQAIYFASSRSTSSDLSLFHAVDVTNMLTYRLSFSKQCKLGSDLLLIAVH